MTENSGYVSRVLKKYAFIVDDNNEFTFLHPSNYVGDFGLLKPGDKVSFMRVKTDKGFNGLGVKRID